MEGNEEEDAYPASARILAGAFAGVLLLLAAVMIDVASDGRLLGRLGRSPADEAERIAKEAVQ